MQIRAKKRLSKNYFSISIKVQFSAHCAFGAAWYKSNFFEQLNVDSQHSLHRVIAVR